MSVKVILVHNLILDFHYKEKKMSDRLHEIIAQIAVIHKELQVDDKIFDFEYVKTYMDDKSSDVQEHYFKLLLQFYFQENNLENLKKLLLLGYQFDLRMDDIKRAFINIKTNEENVIEFFEENVVFVKDSDIEVPLQEMYEYYNSSSDEIKVCLEEAVELIKRNRYVCAYAYKNEQFSFAKFFLNEDLLESLKRDLPYLLK